MKEDINVNINTDESAIIAIEISRTKFQSKTFFQLKRVYRYSETHTYFDKAVIESDRMLFVSDPDAWYADRWYCDQKDMIATLTSQWNIVSQAEKYFPQLEACFAPFTENLKRQIINLFYQEPLTFVAKRAGLLAHYHEHGIIPDWLLRKSLFRLLNDPAWNPWGDFSHLKWYLSCGSGYLNNEFLNEKIWTDVRNWAKEIDGFS